MTKKKWDIHQSRALFNTKYWSSDYFDINTQGEVCVTPMPNQASVSLYQLSQDLVSQGFSFPILVRFANILHHRVRSLCQAFEVAMQIEDYHANYTAIYPIKVNQNYQVVKEILNSGQSNTGLEAGSKAELMAVIGLSAQNALVVCNGYKDREYIRLVLIAQQMGLRPYIVIEKVSELKLIIEESQDMGIKPLLGIRVRLATIGSGKWQNSGGEKAKFGLSSGQIKTVLEQLETAGLLGCLQLMHFHLGSQVANVRDIQRGLSEAARYYAEFCQLGVPIKIVDVGGGLGVDYDGTRSRSHCSINYSMQEYANNVVHELYKVCRAYDLPQPDIISESGRAMTAHHAVLLTNVTDVERIPQLQELEEPAADEPQILHDLWYGLEHLNQRSVLEAYHDAVYLLSEAYSMFTHGLLNLNQRAQAEQIYYATCWKVKSLLQPNLRGHRVILDELNGKLIDKYFCNFSLFQSIPDAWAIDQLFPIMPIHRLDEKPTTRAKLQDLTCDSDGQFDHYVDGEGVESSLPVHEVQDGEEYLLGIFLVGAYQEVLGDMHNLFGDTYSVCVKIDDAGDYTLVEPHEGDRVENMLRYVNIDPSLLRHEYRKRIYASSLNHNQKQAYLRELDSGLMGYTYLEN
ncbi:biosynthetic arginine decarboxylase [Candidatus Albibeggiatoa sp. nov. NOAA]|uniref:biosynthetic arginine decarboxylase n=1 Tax=Candidatus Albibeggiatoa sp. nov. NOAA TaxID=3162724 RepID=UPI003300B8A5|nr:biosynthetic arginine decarboxylase [Thiotrichaceae bacterium]